MFLSRGEQGADFVKYAKYGSHGIEHTDRDGLSCFIDRWRLLGRLLFRKGRQNATVCRVQMEREGKTFPDKCCKSLGCDMFVCLLTYIFLFFCSVLDCHALV